MSFTKQEIADLTKRIQNAGTEVVKTKAGGGGQLPCPWDWRRPASACLWCGRYRVKKAWWYALIMVLCAYVLCAYVEGGGKYARFFVQPLRCYWAKMVLKDVKTSAA